MQHSRHAVQEPVPVPAAEMRVSHPRGGRAACRVPPAERDRVEGEVHRLPMFSGMWFRAIAFVLVYGLLLFFLTRYAKKIERPMDSEVEHQTFMADEKMTKSLKVFGGVMGVGILVVLGSVVFPVLQDLTMIIVAITFLAAGLAATVISGRGGNITRTFINGVSTVLPGVIMILMANSIKFTMQEGNILDALLQAMVGIAKTLPGWSVILFIYLIVLVMNFFISSGSAKAFLLMPLVVPIAETFGISAQLCISAFAFGDGFSNVFYPTNPVLLIAIGLVDVDYGKWVKWTWKFQFINLLMTSAVLLVGLAIGFQ